VSKNKKLDESNKIIYKIFFQMGGYIVQSIPQQILCTEMLTELITERVITIQSYKVHFKAESF